MSNTIPIIPTTPANMPPVLAFVHNDLVPFYHILSHTIWAIGIVLILIGAHRLKQHSNIIQRQASSLATMFYFFVGVLFVGFGPEIIMISQSTFGSGAAHAFSADVSNPVMYYVQQMQEKGLTDAQLIEQATFATLLVIGTIAFSRGFLLLIKLGDGNSQEATMPKATAHSIAGIIGINFGVIYSLMKGFVT